jgi:cation transport ATPase
VGNRRTAPLSGGRSRRNTLPLIAIPVAVIGAISLAARHGIMVKNPAVLEQIDRCRTLIFDKIGTLTYGKPAMSSIHCAPGFREKAVLEAIGSLERYSKHPLAGAIQDAAMAAHVIPHKR